MTPSFDPEQAAANLSQLYVEGENRLTALIQESLSSGALGTARYRALQLSKVQALLSQLQAAAVPQAAQAVSESYVTGALLVDPSLPRSFHGVHTEAAQVLADALATRLNGAVTNVGRHVDDIFRKVGLRHSALSLIQGSSQREAEKAMIEELAQNGITGFTDKAGRDWGLSTYAAMVTRTTTREAASEGTKNRMLENDLDLVTISTHEHPEDVCTPFDGNTYSLTGRTPGYPIIKELPPFHPNCRHVAYPATANLDRKMAQLTEGKAAAETTKQEASVA